MADNCLVNSAGLIYQLVTVLTNLISLVYERSRREFRLGTMPHRERITAERDLG